MKKTIFVSVVTTLATLLVVAALIYVVPIVSKIQNPAHVAYCNIESTPFWDSPIAFSQSGGVSPQWMIGSGSIVIEGQGWWRVRVTIDHISHTYLIVPGDTLKLTHGIITNCGEKMIVRIYYPN